MSFLPSTFQQQSIIIPKLSISVPAPADKSTLNSPLAKGDLNSKLAFHSSRHVSSCAFTNSSRELQYIYDPHLTASPGGTMPDSPAGSLYDRSDLLPGLGKVNSKALSFSCATIVRSTVHTNQDYVKGVNLLAKHLVGASYKTPGHTDLCMPFPPVL